MIDNIFDLKEYPEENSAIADIITLLQKLDYIGAGENTEIAKGRNELITDFSTFKQKIKRKWQSRKL